MSTTEEYLESAKPTDVTATVRNPCESTSESDIGQSLDEHCKLYLLFWDVIVELLLALFGLCGNALSVKVLWRDRLVSTIAFLLIMLSLADVTVLLVIPLLRVSPTLCDVISCASKPQFYPMLHVYGLPLGHLVHLVSSYLIVLVSLHDYLAVCKPRESQKFRTMRAGKISIFW